LNESFVDAKFILATPPPDDLKEDMVTPNDSPIPYSFKFSEVPFIQKPGGTVKIVDSRTFKASKNIAAAEVTVEPGAMRYAIFFPNWVC